MSIFKDKKIVILEMANNHMGDIDHGVKLIEAFGKICKKYSDIEFIFKLQYRDLDSFVHPDYKLRTDLKFIKRFEDTRLSRDEFNILIETMKKNNFKTMSTPFDNISVPRIAQEELDYIKIASCSFGDWPLLEEIVKTDIPIIASTAGAGVDVIDNVVSFFQHREKDFALMHCVGEYPTPKEHMNLSQINYMKNRYEPIQIGLSTHEDPSNYELVKMAVAKGAMIFEKHVGLASDKYSVNGYSVTPLEFENWLEAMQDAYIICGDADKRELNNQNELKTLNDLKRGVVARHDLKAGELLTKDNVYFAFPPEDNQLRANDFSKYKNFKLEKDIKKDTQIYKDSLHVSDNRSEVWDIVTKVKKLIKESGVTLSNGSDLEISHHYGIENFYEYGICMITVINREYCKKLIIILPNQKHPQQYHKQKEETFHLLYGDLNLVLDDKPITCSVGDVVLVEPMIKHSFSTVNGAVIEEMSSTHIQDDSFYTDEKITNNKKRKTIVSFWMD